MLKNRFMINQITYYPTQRQFGMIQNMKNAGVGTWIKDNTIGRIPFTNAWVDRKERKAFQNSAIGQVAGMFGINKMSQLTSAVGSGAKMLGNAMQNSKSGFLQSLGKSLGGVKINPDGSKSESHPNGTETKINATQNNGSGNKSVFDKSTADRLNKANQANHDTKANQSSKLLQTIKGFDSTIGNKGGRSDHKSDDVIRGLREDRRNAQSGPANQKSYDRWTDYTNKQIKLGKMTKEQADDFLKTKKYSNANLGQLIKTFSKKYHPKRYKKTAYEIGTALGDTDTPVIDYFKYKLSDAKQKAHKHHLKPKTDEYRTYINNYLDGYDDLDSIKLKSNEISNRLNRMYRNSLRNPKSYLKGIGIGAAAGGSISGVASALLSDRIKYQIQMRHPDWDDNKVENFLNKLKFGITSGGTLIGAGAGALTTRGIINFNYNKSKNKLSKSRGTWMI